MKSHIFRALLAALFVVVGACGGSSSGSGNGQLTLQVPKVEVNGLATGGSVTLRMQPGGETITISADGTRSFAKKVPSGSDHTVSIASVGGTTCLFANGKASSTLDDPSIKHVLNCGTAIPAPDDGAGGDGGSGGDGSGDGSGGGDGGTGGGSGDTATDAELALTLTGAGGNIGTAERPITSSEKGTVRATLTRDGTPLSNEVVTFEVTIGKLDPESGTALTDGTGRAVIDILAGDMSGAGTLTASVDLGDEQVLTQHNFQISSDGSSSDPTPVEAEPAIGNGTGVDFEEGVLAVSTTAASAGSTVSVTATIVDASKANESWANVAQVAFTSNCVSADTAIIDSPVTLIGGSASATYTPQAGCISDTIIASVTVNGEQLVASSPLISVEQALPNSITFLQAAPNIIGLKGSGQAGVPETSTLTFQIRDANGQAVGPGTAVDFDIVAGTGGFSITSGTSSTTNSAGEVSVTVASGSVPTIGTIRATIQGTAIEASGSVSIQTGIASQERFSIAVESLNPVNGAHLGETVQVSARAADRFGNWVPDGTQINFTTELGDIEPSCETVDGGCSVTWTSQGEQLNFFDADRANRACFNNGVMDADADKQGLIMIAPCGEHDRFGRSTITAWTVGEEAFQDANGNNLFDETESWTAMPEAFRDNNEVGLRTADVFLIDEFMDFNGNGGYDTPGTKFRGLGCTEAATIAGHCADGLANVRDSAMIVLPTDTVQLLVFAGGTAVDLSHWDDGAGGSPTQWGNASLANSPPQVASVAGPSASLTVVVADLNGNAPAEGTTVTVKGEDMKPTGAVNCTVGSRTEPKVCSFSFFYDGDKTGTVLKPINIEAESGGITVHRSINASVP